MGLLEGKVAIVSGAAGGLGTAFTRTLAGEGASILAFDIKPSMPALASSIASEVEGEVLGVVADIAERRDVERLAHTALEAYGGLDILINNAAIFERTPVSQTWEDALSAFERITNTNILGPMMLERVCIGLMMARGGGHIVNISASDVLPGGQPGMNAGDCDVYNASKWALNGMTSDWGRALEEENIRVNGLCVGPTATPLMEQRYDSDPAERARVLTPAEVAGVLLELLTELGTRTAENIGIWSGSPLELPAPKPVHRRLF